MSEIAAHPTHRMDAEYWINRHEEEAMRAGEPVDTGQHDYERTRPSVTVDYGDGMATVWPMSKFMAIGVTAYLEREHGEGRTEEAESNCAVCGDAQDSPMHTEHTR
jgi:hypothetical protein